MVRLTIAMPDQMKAFIAAPVTQRSYASADDDLQALIQQDQKRRALKELEAKLLEGIEGPSVLETQDFWASIRKQALEEMAGEVIRP